MMNLIMEEVPSEHTRQCYLVMRGLAKLPSSTVLRKINSAKTSWYIISIKQPSEGVDFFGKNVVHASKNHRLQLWDTSGNERYRKLIPNYLKNATCGLFIYDRTGKPTLILDLTTLQNLENWIKIFKESRKQRATIALCENKNDLSFSAHKNKLKTINDPNNTI